MIGIWMEICDTGNHDWQNHVIRNIYGKIRKVVKENIQIHIFKLL